METKTWIKCDPSNINGCAVYYQKSDDIYPLRYWRGKVELPKSLPIDVLNFVLNARRIWDLDLIEFSKIAEIDQETEINQVLMKLQNEF